MQNELWAVVLMIRYVVQYKLWVIVIMGRYVVCAV